MSDQLNWSIIKWFSSRNRYGFTRQDVVKAFPERNPNYISRVLTNMVRRGMLLKIYHGIYHIIPLNAVPETYQPDNHQMAKYLMRDQKYYIGYTSALKIHGLITGDSAPEPGRQGNPKAVEYVVTAKQVKPSIRNIDGMNYRFIQHDESRFFGFTTTTINQMEEICVSELEKTIVDIATRPQLCGGIMVLGHALVLAKERIKQDRLLLYLAGNKKKSAMKRVLFLTELLALEWTDGHERMQEELGTGIALLDPAAPDQGRKWYRYGLKINVDPIEIKTRVLENPSRAHQ